MNDITPSFDLSSEDFGQMLDAAESVDGVLSVTSEGRLIIYGLDGRAEDIAKRQPFPAFFVEALDEGTLGFTF